MKSNILVALIYLWTRDAEMSISKETEDYISGQLKAINKSGRLKFSDRARQNMALRLTK